MRAVILKAINDLRRRRLQAAVLFATALLSVGTATMALTLLSQSRDPYHSAFEAQRGAHLQVAYDGRIDPVTISSTPALIGASESGGPYPATDVQFEFRAHKVSVTAIGRDNPGGRVEQLRLTAGHWPANDHEIALTRSFVELNHISVGDTVRVVSVSQQPRLTVVAEVVDIDESGASSFAQPAWMRSSAMPAVSRRDASYSYMDYRFSSDPTSAQLQADVSRLRASLPQGSISNSTDYLAVKRDYNTLDQLIADLLLAFSTFALLATVAIVANLVTGIVISAYREIGIMKAIGFTPGQVELAFVLQIVIPAAAAAAVAIPLGTLASQPLLANSAHALGVAYQPEFSPALDALIFVGALVIVAAAALLPAFRAGRLKAAEVIANASAPRGRSGSFLRALAARAGLPRPVALGVGDAFARRLRGVLTLVAIFVGVTTATVAVAVPRSFTLVQATMTTGRADVVVQRSPALTDTDAMRILNAESQTETVVGELDQNVVVPGISDPIKARIFRGDRSHLGFVLVSGRWFERPGEVVAPRKLIHDAHLSAGEHFTATVGSKPVSLTLVGELFDVGNFGYTLSTDAATVSRVEPDAAPTTYLVTVRPGSNVDAYVRRVGAAQPDLLDVQRNTIDTSGSSAGVVQTVLLIVAAVIAAIAVAAIFNTLLLNTRERVRDIATLKAIGMSPRQVMTMVAASSAPLALVAGLLAAPAGVGINRVFLTLLLGGVGGNDTPAAIYDVFTPWQLVVIPLAGVAVAVAAALIPGRWAARTNVVAALQAE